MADGALTGDGHVVGVVHFVADLVVVVRRRRRGARLADGRRRRVDDDRQHACAVCIAGGREGSACVVHASLAPEAGRV